jgi:iron complex transport system ATP-binding protein
MAISVRNLNFAYGATPVLKNVDLDLPAGQLNLLLGRNGGGKSTLLRLIAGSLKPAGGLIRFHDEPAGKLQGAARARMVGYLPQFHQAVFPFSVEQVVLTGRAAYVASLPAASDRAAADRALATVGIEHLRMRPYSELSGGERQLVMLARVLCQEPRIILLDEPVSHLDLANQTRVLDLLKRLSRQGITILSVLHDPNAALLYGDTLTFLVDGRIVCPQPGQNVWSPAFLSQVYGTELDALSYGDQALVIARPGHR